MELLFRQESIDNACGVRMESFNYPTEMVLAGMSLQEIKEHVFQEFLKVQPKPFRCAEELFKEWVFSDKFVFYPWPI